MEEDILTCILQGSILGPILFLIYINDLHLISNALTLMFADDTLGLKAHANLETLIAEVNNDINRMAIWFKANKLVVNKSKTKYIIFKQRNKKIGGNLPKIVYDENEPGKPYSLDNVTELERIHSKHDETDKRAYKLLGIYLDDGLTLDYHVNYLIKKLNRSLFCIRNAKNYLNNTGLRSLYFALIHSHLSYCPTIISCTSNSNINKLFKLQKKAIRIITNSSYNAHTLPLFYQHKILPLTKIFLYDKLKFMHAINYNYAIKSFENVWNKNINRDLNVHLRNDDLFQLPAPNIELFKKLPLYSLPYEWNNSGDLKFYENLVTFNCALKNKLFDEVLFETGLN